ncbi:hypothetical protein [Butyricimonas virosa]|uniref:Polysaccharide (De)acetylase n=1 Tax=Butyricimonas virosa TaxID=544645 RepID=A0A415QI20_9BACT|nr:hypothetical protein [Butyricimonas virosa]RHM43000.1 hypothetical protein DWZ68_10205 [Butyricimonas virosa]
MSLKQTITHNLLNILGWRTKRHIVVIESDDWGSIRMPSKKVYDKLLRAGIRVDKCHYCMNDSIASEDDISLLFEVLSSVKDKNDSPVVITANAVVANPDFKKIKESDFSAYFFKRIDEGMKEIKGCENVLSMWKQGQNEGYFRIQSHGREHVNISRWMYYLRNDFPETRLAFDYGVYGISTTITNEKRKSFLPAFDFENNQEESIANNIVADGLKNFENIFGFKSKSFIAPNYTWGKSLERTIANYGVKYIQGSQISRYRNAEGENNKCRLRYIGKRNDFGQIDLARNAFFEPSENQDKDWIDSCLSDIAIAFRYHHPAIISAHRVNFVGTINVHNRDKNLVLLKDLLIGIKKQWPDVEFMSSDQLGDLITKNNE